MIESTIVSAVISAVQNVTRITLALHLITSQIKRGFRDSVRDFDSGEVELKLDISLQKLLRWQTLWTGDETRSGDFWQRLWGQSGCISVLELLAKIQEDCSEIETATTRLGGVRSDAITKGNIRLPSKLPKLPRCFRVVWKRQVLQFEGKEIRSQAERLCYHVEQLWTVSEMSFRTHNGNTVEEMQPLADQSLAFEMLMQKRAQSTALYHYCSTRGLDFDLEIDLVRGEADCKSPSSLTNRLGSPLCYHLFTASSTNSVIFNDLLVVPLEQSEVEGVQQDQIICTDKDSESVDLAVVASKSQILCVRDGPTASQSFFQVSLPVNSVNVNVESEVLAAVLEKLQQRRLLDVADRLPLVEKIRLAYKIVECGLFLLGTPWLSHLNSETLRRIIMPDFQRRYVLHVQSSEKPNEKPPSQALLVRAQIFQIGILLVEIALDRPSCLAGMEDLEFGSSIIPYVERSMGHRYKQACEFCLTRKEDDGFFLDQKDASGSNGLPRQSDSNWMLRQYYAEVFVRYAAEVPRLTTTYLWC
jgi:hypothetical protein